MNKTRFTLEENEELKRLYKEHSRVTLRARAVQTIYGVESSVVRAVGAKVCFSQQRTFAGGSENDLASPDADILKVCNR